MTEFAVDLRIAIPKLSFSCASESRLIALTGPSGIGKTTLLRAVAGIHPSLGTIEVGQMRLDPLPPAARGVGYCPQDALLFPHLTVAENLTFARRESTLSTQLTEGLALAPLLPRHPQTLSGGERQRVAFARALIHAERLLLLDEPYSAQHAPMRATMLEFTKQASARHVVLVTSHEPQNLLALAADCFEVGAP